MPARTVDSSQDLGDWVEVWPPATKAPSPPSALRPEFCVPVRIDAVGAYGVVLSVEGSDDGLSLPVRHGREAWTSDPQA